MKRNIVFFILCLLLASNIAFGQITDLSRASILISPKIKLEVQESSMRILSEEVSARSGISLNKVKDWKSSENTVIALEISNSKKLIGQPVPGRDKNI